MVFVFYANTPEKFRDQMIRELERRRDVAESYRSLARTNVDRVRSEAEIRSLATLAEFLREATIRPESELPKAPEPKLYGELKIDKQ